MTAFISANPATLDLADDLIGAERQAEAYIRRITEETDAAIAAAHANGYGAAVADLERATINLRAFSRGMIGKDALGFYIEQARAALRRAEAAL